MLHQVKHGQALALHQRQDSVLTIQQGGAWITFDKVNEDFFLTQGESLTVPAKTKLVVEAHEPSAVLVFELKSGHSIDAFLSLITQNIFINRIFGLR